MYIFCVYFKSKQTPELPSMKLYDEEFNHHVLNVTGMNIIL